MRRAWRCPAAAASSAVDERRRGRRAAGVSRSRLAGAIATCRGCCRAWPPRQLPAPDAVLDPPVAGADPGEDEGRRRAPRTVRVPAASGAEDPGLLLRELRLRHDALRLELTELLELRQLGRHVVGGWAGDRRLVRILIRIPILGRLFLRGPATSLPPG